MRGKFLHNTDPVYTAEYEHDVLLENGIHVQPFNCLSYLLDISPCDFFSAMLLSFLFQFKEKVEKAIKKKISIYKNKPKNRSQHIKDCIVLKCKVLIPTFALDII